MTEVAKKTSIPIATGERLTTKYEFFDILKKQFCIDNSNELGGELVEF